MARGRHTTVDTGAVLETLATLFEAGETIDNGGVPATRVADELPHHRTTLENTLSDLEARGAVRHRWGFTDNGPRRSYVPADAHAEGDIETPADVASRTGGEKA